MIRVELLSFSFKMFIKERKEGLSPETFINLYSENTIRDEFEDFSSYQLRLYSDRLIEEGKYVELVSVTTQVVSTALDIIYVFSLEFEDVDIFEE